LNPISPYKRLSEEQVLPRNSNIFLKLLFRISRENSKQKDIAGIFFRKLADLLLKFRGGLMRVLVRLSLIIPMF
jgi:hypothetical protein